MVEKNHPVDCTTVVSELYTFLDGELTEARRALIARHLTLCVDCHEVVDFYAELKMVVAQRCRDRVPDNLQARIVQSLGSPPPDLGGGIPRL